ncbi:MAG: glycosyltransferase family 4 protein [Chloroflexota bacterium]|nr:glycosyltransferase family 4 protein [Chloroflexota bacterium]
MKILQISNGLPPVDRGGVEVYTLALSKSLRSKGHDVAVFCREPGGNRPIYSVRDEITEGIPARFVVNRFDGTTPLASRYFDRQIEALFARWLEAQQPDVIHFQHTHGLSASLLARAAEMGLPFVMTLHDYWYMCPQVNLLRPDNNLCIGSHHDVNCYECLFDRPYPPFGPNAPDFDAPLSLPSVEPVNLRPLSLSDATYYPLQRILPWPARRLLLSIYDVMRLRVLPQAQSLLAAVRPTNMEPLRVRARYMQALLALCKYIIAPSNVVKTQYVDFGIPAKRIRVVPHGIDMSVWEDFQPSHRPRGQVLRFGYIGSLLRHKGVDFIIRAFQRLDVPNTELWIHGFELPGMPFTEMLHELADGDPRVHFAGPYTPPELPSILNQIDVLLIPSRWHETFSIVTREAVLARLPVIASRMGGIPDAIDDGVNGILLPPDDMEAWVAAMQRAVGDRELVAALHRAQLIRKVKSMDEHAVELIQLYAQMQDDLPR